MLSSLDPPSTPLLLDLSSDTSSHPVVRLLARPLPEFGTFVFSMGISNVVIVNSQRVVYVNSQSHDILQLTFNTFKPMINIPNRLT
jgi:hypothetical protein